MNAPAFSTRPGVVFDKPTLIRGRPGLLRCVELCGQVFSIGNGPLRVMRLEDEWYEDLADPYELLDRLKSYRHLGIDILTFWQRIPAVERRYSFHCEGEDLAVLPVTGFDRWFNEQIKARVRNQIRKSQKAGIEVHEVPYDDHFVRGMTDIFNESPIRQGRPFWHYGKDFETVKAQFSRYVHREVMLAAYLEGRMIGLVMLADAGRFALTAQVISSLHHRDKSVNNLLIAKCVEVCAQRGWEHLVYLFWSDDSLAEFKRRCGFERVTVPRYYVPLSWNGRVAIRMGLHRGWRALVPASLRAKAKYLRSRWHLQHT